MDTVHGLSGIAPFRVANRWSRGILGTAYARDSWGTYAVRWDSGAWAYISADEFVVL